VLNNSKNLKTQLNMKNPTIVIKTKRHNRAVSQAEDIQVLKEIKEGNSEAFGRIYNKYKKFIVSNFFFKLNGDKDLVDDLVADLFTKVLERINSYKSETFTFNTWLTSVANNFLIDYIRVNGRFMNTNISIEKAIDYESESNKFIITEETLSDVEMSNPEKDFIKSEQSKLMLDLVNSSLKGNMLDVVKLRYYENKEYKEIVELTGLSLSSVKIMLLRAKPILATVIKRK